MKKKNINVTNGQLNLFTDFGLTTMSDEEFDDLATKVVKTKRELLQQALLFADPDEAGSCLKIQSEMAEQGKKFSLTKKQYDNILAVRRVEKFFIGLAKKIGIFVDWANPQMDITQSGWGALAEVRNRIGTPKSLNDAAIAAGTVKSWLKKFYYSQNGVYIPASERFSEATRKNLKKETADAALLAARETPTSLNAVIEDGEGAGTEMVQNLPDLDSFETPSELLDAVLEILPNICTEREESIFRYKLFNEQKPEDVAREEIPGYDELPQAERLRIRNRYSKALQSATKKVRGLFLDNGKLATKFPVIHKALTS